MTASFNSLSKDVTRDMTQTLTSVNQKVEAFNMQVKDLNESQRGINKILAGVKKFGTLAEFSLGSLLDDLLPASQYLSNVKMKEDTSENGIDIKRFTTHGAIDSHRSDPASLFAARAADLFMPGPARGNRSRCSRGAPRDRGRRSRARRSPRP